MKHYMNLRAAHKVYEDDQVQGIIETLMDFEEYHLLAEGSMATWTTVWQKFPGLSREYLPWLKLCDGGNLFRQVEILSSGVFRENTKEIDTYDNCNQKKSEYGISNEYTIFAKTNQDNLMCFKKGCNTVFEFDKNGEVVDTWLNFFEWISEVVSDGVGALYNGDIESFDIKEKPKRK